MPHLEEHNSGRVKSPETMKLLQKTSVILFYNHSHKGNFHYENMVMCALEYFWMVKSYLHRNSDGTKEKNIHALPTLLII